MTSEFIKIASYELVPVVILEAFMALCRLVSFRELTSKLQAWVGVGELKSYVNSKMLVAC